MDMGVSMQCIDFWSIVEKEVNTVIPAHIKNLLNLAGYSTAFTVKELDEQEIEKLQEFAKDVPPLISKYCNQNHIAQDQNTVLCRHFLGLHDNQENFQIFAGERMLLRRIAEWVEKKVSQEANFLNRVDKRSTTVKTIVGELFAAEESVSDDVDDSINKEVSNHALLSEMTTCFNQNVTRFMAGYRYTEDLKLYCAYNRMIGGKLAYETLAANSQHALPGDRSVCRYIDRAQSTAVEGVLRTHELSEYLTKLKLPRIVALSEDATRITSRAQYDPKTNQIVGFVLPLGKNGMPFANYNNATSTGDIEKCFYNIRARKENELASNANCVMAQPLVPGMPAFCLQIFGTNSKYGTKDIEKRWIYIIDELKKKQIEVITFASDSDPKFNSLMQYHIHLGRCGKNNMNFPEWFSASFSSQTKFIPIQDMVHIGTKFRNRMLNRTMKMGNYDVSVEHLMVLLETFTKEKHNLCPLTICPKDRQNFESVLRICDERVIDLLCNVEGSEGTVLYLRVMDSVLRSFLDVSLKPIERIRYIWFAIFILRIWHKFILKSKKYSTEEHFISSNCYSCVEINAHSMVFLMLYLREHNLDKLFHPEMLGSQACERIFRQVRSLSTTYSTVTNCSVLEMIRKLSKVELQNEISHIRLKHWNFPRLGLPASSHYKVVDRNGINQYAKCARLPSQEEIMSEIELAKLEAIELAESVGMSVKNQDYTCKFQQKNKTTKKNSLMRVTQILASPKQGIQYKMLILYSSFQKRI